ncbi:hypothetical protein AX15_003504, partial [Amanita polypyramis BW_CC]
HCGAVHVNPSAHKSVPECRQCHRFFKNGAALNQHLRDAPVHWTNCYQCHAKFNNESELNQHVYDVHHTASFCHQCRKVFKNETGLNNHLRGSPVHNQVVLSSNTSDKETYCLTCKKEFKNTTKLRQVSRIEAISTH